MGKPGGRTRQVDAYRRLLLNARRELVAGRLRREHIATVEPVPEEDLAPVSHDEFVALEMNGLDYEKLRMVDEALDRIAAGDYGLCLGCDHPIPDKRLRAVPWARYCVECQERLGVAREEPRRLMPETF